MMMRRCINMTMQVLYDDNKIIVTIAAGKSIKDIPAVPDPAHGGTGK